MQIGHLRQGIYARIYSMKHVFIVNRISGKGAALSLTDVIRKCAEEAGLDYEIRITDYEGHAKQIASEYSDPETVIYAVGGDGTILEVLNGMDHSLPFGVIPAGSGNDFYRYFDNGRREEMSELIRHVIAAEPIDVDLGINDHCEFINTTSIGLDAMIADDAVKLIRRTFLSKGPSYILSILRNLITFRRTKMRLLIDGKQEEGTFLIVACMNGKYYGNGVKAAPSADLSDGLFDLVMVRDIGRFRSYALVGKYMSGKHEGDPNIVIRRCRNIHIESDEEMSIQSDGENYTARSLDIRMQEKAIHLKMPKEKNS